MKGAGNSAGLCLKTIYCLKMKKFLSCSLAMMLGLATLSAATIVTPEEGKYYRIRHASGLVLSNTWKSTLAAEKADNSQIVQFEPIGDASALNYRIKRVSSGLYIGTDLKWSSVGISRQDNKNRVVFRIEAVDGGNYVTLRNLAMNAQNKDKACLGTDKNEAGEGVFTDKPGNRAENDYWIIEEAQLYPAGETPADKYPDHQLADDDPRANAYDGYKLVFAQEFSGEGTPDHEIWNFEEGFKRNNEDQYYNGDKNCYIKDGVLVIEGRHVLDEKIRNPKYDKYNNSWPSKIGKYLTWTSGSMQTKGSWNSGYTWKFGIYEVRAKVPQYVGSWPAIWSTGMQHEWPYGGEIDIMEYYGNRIHANVCWGDGKRWAGHWNSATVHDNDLGKGWGDEYHIWRMVWDYDHMELWCDDWLVNNIDLDTTNNDKYTAGDIDDGDGCNPFRDVRHMLWLNLALGGNNGGSLAKTPRPLYYLIDYARVYQKVGTDGLATYKVDDTLSEPTFNVKDGETAGVTDIVVSEEAAGEAGVFNLQGIRVADTLECAKAKNLKGLFIVTGSEGSSKVVL